MAAARLRALLLLVVLVAVGVSGCSKEQAYEDRETFYYAMGTRGSGFVARGAASDNGTIRFVNGAALDGRDVMPLDGCLLAQFAKEPAPAGPADPFRRAGPDAKPNPQGANYGRAAVAGRLYGDVPIEVSLQDFVTNADWHDGGVRFNFDAFGDGTDGPLPLPRVPAQLAAWGRAVLLANSEQIPDPVSGIPPGYNPDEDQLNWTSEFYVLKSGLRDNATKAMHDRSGAPFNPHDATDARLEAGDLEAHLFLVSRIGQPHPTKVFWPGPPVIADRPYADTVDFFNAWFPGKATFTFRVTTQAPTLQLTDLTFTVLDPAGKPLSRTTLGGSAGSTETKNVTVPLDQPKSYGVRVTGNATLATYDITATFVGEASLFWFWWEDLQIGKQSVGDYTTCAREVTGDTFRPLPLIVDTPTPPGLVLVSVILGVVGALLYGLFLTKLAMDQASTGDFKRRFRKR